MSNNPRHVDLLVIGAGAGGMTAALTASLMGLDVLLVEKTDQIGGTSAVSAGSVWAPNSRHSTDGKDSLEKALTYLQRAIGNQMDLDRTLAFLKAAPEMIELLETQTEVNFQAYLHHPDYFATLEGATLSGRVLEPLPFDGSLLGNDFSKLRRPLPGFTLFGGMMVDRTDISHLLRAKSNLKSLFYSLKILARFAVDRVRHKRGTRLVMGNALVGRLYLALKKQRVAIHTGTTVTSLQKIGNRISKAVLQDESGSVEITVRAGVVLASGGLSHHSTLRQTLNPAELGNISAVVDSASGDGLNLAANVGGRVASTQGSNSFWAPVSHHKTADGSTAVFPHFVLDRGKPGIIAVDQTGQRFVNEATTYHLFGEALLETKKENANGACFLICDDNFVNSYGLGLVRPGRFGLNAALRDGYLQRAETLSELAEKISVPSTTLSATVERCNDFALTGKDEDFSKGEDAYQLNMGDPRHQPNACLGELKKPPFYAVEIFPGDIGASAGLASDASARVLDENGQPILGLFACGNDMASIMADRYPGPGITLGPAMTFGYVAAKTAQGDLEKH